MKNKAKYILLGVVLGICISLTLTSSYAGLKRIKQQNKRIEKLSLRSLDKRITKIEKQLKGERNGQMVK